MFVEFIVRVMRLFLPLCALGMILGLSALFYFAGRLDTAIMTLAAGFVMLLVSLVFAGKTERTVKRYK
jgi:hypothetical protein